MTEAERIGQLSVLLAAVGALFATHPNPNELRTAFSELHASGVLAAISANASPEAKKAQDALYQLLIGTIPQES